MRILNTTNLPFEDFTVVMRLATKGMHVIDMPTTDPEEVYRMCDNIDLAMVIVDHAPDGWKFANAVCNGVSCPVVTPAVWVDIDEDGHAECRFDEYDIERLCSK